MHDDVQVVATLVPCFQQWTGINSVMFYAPIIFKTINPQSGALLATMITGVINVLATFISIALVEKAGRKVSTAALCSVRHVPGRRRSDRALSFGFWG